MHVCFVFRCVLIQCPSAMYCLLTPYQAFSQVLISITPFTCLNKSYLMKSASGVDSLKSSSDIIILIFLVSLLTNFDGNMYSGINIRLTQQRVPLLFLALYVKSNCYNYSNNLCLYLIIRNSLLLVTGAWLSSNTIRYYKFIRYKVLLTYITDHCYKFLPIFLFESGCTKSYRKIFVDRFGSNLK